MNTCSISVARKHRIKVAFSVDEFEADLARSNILVGRRGLSLPDVLKCAQEFGLAVRKGPEWNERRPGTKQRGPGSEKRGKLGRRSNEPALFVRSFKSVRKDPELIEELLKNPRNSLVGGMSIYDKDEFRAVKSDQFYDPRIKNPDGSEADSIGHAMSITGIGKQQRKQVEGGEEDYFLECLNSYGNGFGDEGFIKVKLDLFTELYVITEFDFLGIKVERSKKELKDLKAEKTFCKLSKAVAFLESAIVCSGNTPEERARHAISFLDVLKKLLNSSGARRDEHIRSFNTTSARGFVKPTAKIVPFGNGVNVIQQEESRKAMTRICSGISMQLDYTSLQCQALVLTPTGELAHQFKKVMESIGKDRRRVMVGAFVGTTNIEGDARILEAGVHVAVGTPMRVRDLLRRQFLRPKHIIMFLIHEADKISGGRFKALISEIYQLLPEHIQVGVFCDTISTEVDEITEKFRSL